MARVIDAPAPRVGGLHRGQGGKKFRHQVGRLLGIIRARVEDVDVGGVKIQKGHRVGDGAEGGDGGADLGHGGGAAARPVAVGILAVGVASPVAVVPAVRVHQREDRDVEAAAELSGGGGIAEDFADKIPECRDRGELRRMLPGHEDEGAEGVGRCRHRIQPVKGTVLHGASDLCHGDKRQIGEASGPGVLLLPGDEGLAGHRSHRGGDKQREGRLGLVGAHGERCTAQGGPGGSGEDLRKVAVGAVGVG